MGVAVELQSCPLAGRGSSGRGRRACPARPPARRCRAQPRERGRMAGVLTVFEGLDQSGKQTQAELLRDRLKADGHRSRIASFPDYGTSIGEEIARALQGERDYSPDVMQLLYIANRYERKADLLRWLEGGLIL